MLTYAHALGSLDLNALLTTAASVASTIPKVGDYAKDVCSIATGDAATAAGSWVGSQLNPSQSNILNQTANYANSVCKGVSPAAGGATTASPKVMTFKLPSALQAKAQASTATYPVGTIFSYDAKAGGYRVAVPIGTQVSGFDGTPTHAQAAIALQKPTSANAREVSTAAYKEAIGETPFYRTTLGMIALGVGGVAVLATGVLLVRRRRAPAAVSGLAGSPYEHARKVMDDLSNVSAYATDAAQLIQIGACSHAFDKLREADQWVGHLGAEWWWSGARDASTAARVEKARRTVGMLNKSFERRCVHGGPPKSWSARGRRQRAPTVEL